ncbi:hypothetical protein OIV83_004687 [Microbotryomycetes sp. JL201]|nr:hypothetical protein OIV83_004687 [Microbotryomycetes sp. JL201]
MPTPRSAVLQAVEKAVDKLTPLALADSSWDNVGLMIEAAEPRQVAGAQRVMLCIDLTTAVCDEALSDPQTTCILTYHPPIFSGLKSLTLQTPLQRSLLRAAAQGVSVFCIHTAADNAIGGVNDFLAKALADGNDTRKAIEPEQNPPEGHEGSGTGRLVTLPSSMAKQEVVDRVKKALGRDFIQAAWADDGPEEIQTIAICAGSGESVLRGVKADLYLTGELGHHYVLSFNAQGIHCLVCNHSATERPWLPTFASRLEQEMNKGSTRSDFEVVVSRADREPLQVV